jgi:hypothetical protein
VYDWVCEVCGERQAWDDVDWKGSLSEPPDCHICASNGIPASLSGLLPSTQHELMEETADA